MHDDLDPQVTPPGDGRPGGTVAVIVVDHGTRSSEVNAEFEASVRSGAGLGSYGIVEPAHMELAEPSLATAFGRCVAAGATTVAVAPYFLGPGRHWDRDIPALVAAAAARHPGVRWMVTGPLGPDPRLLDLVGDRVARCLAHVAGEAGECATCAGTGRCALR